MVHTTLVSSPKTPSIEIVRGRDQPVAQQVQPQPGVLGERRRLPAGRRPRPVRTSRVTPRTSSAPASAVSSAGASLPSGSPSAGAGNQTSSTAPLASSVARPWPQAVVGVVAHGGRLYGARVSAPPLRVTPWSTSSRRRTPGGSASRPSCSTEPRPDDLLDVVRHLTVLQTEPTAPLGAPTPTWCCGAGSARRTTAAELRDASTSRCSSSTRATSGPARTSRCSGPRWRSGRAASRSRSGSVDNARVGRGQRRLPARHPRRLRRDGSAADQRVAGHLRGAVAVVGLEQQQERPDAAQADGRSRRGRRRRPSGPQTLWDLAERIYPDDPVPDPDEARRLRDERRLRALGMARAKAAVQPGEPHHVGEAGEPAVVEGVKGEWRVEPSLAGPAVRGPRRAAVAVRPAGPGPQAARPALRVRLPARDVQAGRAADLGLLRAPDPPRRPAGREARRDRRAGRRRAPGRRRCTRTSPGPT